MAHTLSRIHTPLVAAVSGALLISCAAADPSAGGLTDESTQGPGDQPQTTFTPLPCDVQRVVNTSCLECHGEQTLYGAPMSLLSTEAFHEPAPTDSSIPTFHKVHERVNSPNQPMPPPPYARVEGADLAVLNGWLEAGAPAGDGSACAGGIQPPPPPISPSSPPVNGSGGTSPTPTTAPTSTTTPPAPTSTTQPTDPTMLPPDVQCHIFRAHGQTVAGDTSPYDVGVVTDNYINFSLNAPWQGTVYATTFRPITDNPAVVHHYLLYKEGAAVAEGGIRAGIGEHPGAELTYGWAPGARPLELPPGVGFEMPATGYTLELHYNSSDPTAVDSSGVEVCYTATRPAEVANMTWLGTDDINGTQATGECNPWNGNTQPIHILSVWPHMHLKGVRMTAIINRANGTKEALIDEPFDFNYQINYARDVWLNPGDTVTTSCAYNSPATFGQATTAEMCYLFTVATPGGDLSDGGSVVAHGPNTCGVRYCVAPGVCFL